MPLTDFTKRYQARKLGLDPDLLEDVPNYEPPVQQNPVVKPTPVSQQKPKTSAIGALAGESARNMLPGFAALATGASIVNPFIGIPAALGVGLLARKLQDVGVESLAPESIAQGYKESEQQHYTEHPLASTIGSMTTPALKPQIGALKPIGQGLRNLATIGPSAVNAAQINALKNAALGATIPTGLRATFDENVTAPELIAEAAGGALLHPSKYGIKYLGLKPTIVETGDFDRVKPNSKKNPVVGIPEPVKPSVYIPEEQLAAAKKASPVRASTVEQEPYVTIPEKALAEAKSIPTTKVAPKFERPLPGPYDEVSKLRKEVEVKQAEELKQQYLDEATQRQESENRAKEETLRRQEDFAKAKVEEAELIKAEETKQAAIKARSEAFEKQLAEQAAKNPYVEGQKKLQEQRETKKAVKSLVTNPPEPLQNISDNVPAPKTTTELGKELHPDYTGNLEADVAANKAPLSEGEQIQEKVDRTGKLQETSGIIKGLEEKGYSSKPNQSIVAAFKKLAKRRNIKVADIEKVFDAEGKEIAGKSFERTVLTDALAQINPNKASIDTYPHELLHPFLKDLETLGSGGDAKLVSRAYAVLGKSEAFNKWKTALPEGSAYKKLDNKAQVNEFLTTITGEDTIRRILRTDNRGAFRSFLKDFWSNIKSRWGNATEEDIARLMSNKLVNEKPFSEGMAGKVDANLRVPPVIDPKSQEESKLSGDKYQEEQVNLLKSYNDLKTKLMNTKFSEETKGQLIKDYGELDKITKKLEQLTPAKPFNNQEESRLKSTSQDESKLQTGSEIKNTKEIEEPKEFSIPGMRPEIEKIRRAGGKGPEIAEGFTNFLEKKTENEGRFVNKFGREVRSLVNLDGVIRSIVSSPINYKNQNTPELDNVRDWFWAKQDGEELPKLNENEDKIKEAFLRSNKDVFSEAEARKLKKKGQYREDLLVNMPSRPVLRELLSRPDSTKSKELKQEFLDYYKKKGKTEKEAQEVLDTLLGGHGKQEVNTANQFQAIDKASGIGLPKGWREQSLLDSQNRFLERVSRRFAYHDEIESKGLTKDIDSMKGNESVEAVFNDIAGNRFYDDPLISGIQGVIRAGMLGTLTGERDLATGLTLGFQHFENPYQAVKNTAKSVLNLKENLTDAWESGRIRRHLSSLEMGNGYDDIISVLKRTRDIGSDLSGRNWFDQMIRAINFGSGRLAALDFMEQKLSGKLSKSGEKFFEDFGRGIDWQNKDTFTPEELKTIAGRFVDSVQGTYDYRGLPRQAFEGSIAPWLQLSRWGIEKTNNFTKYAVNPALKGDYKPLLMSLLGAYLGGSAVEKITELTTGRKKKQADYKEIKAAHEAGKNVLPDVVYKAIGLMAAGSHIGIVGDLTKSIMDAAYGKNRPQAYNNVLLEFAESSAANMANLLKTGIDEGVSFDLLANSVGQFFEDNIQTYRILNGHLNSDKAEDIEKSNKLRDLRTFNTLNGKAITDLSNPFALSFSDLPIKKFKRADSIEEARDMLPGLISRALEKANGDPEVFQKEMTKIKKNSYQTMPNPDKWPISFRNYVTFLEKTQGKDVAQERVLDYIKKNELNREKSAMVP